MAHLEPALLEIARVLRPGGIAVLSDIHPFNTMLGGRIAGFPERDITQGIPYVVNHTHPISSYLAAFRAGGLSVVECHEPTISEVQLHALPSFAFYPEASRQALAGIPFLLIWHLRREPAPG